METILLGVIVGLVILLAIKERANQKREAIIKELTRNIEIIISKVNKL